MAHTPSPGRKRLLGLWGDNFAGQACRRRCGPEVRFEASNAVESTLSSHEAGSAAQLMMYLPHELLDKVMDHLTAKELASLEATCKHFVAGRVVQKYAQYRLQRSGRAQNCLMPAQDENWVSLLEFVECQTLAHAQATAVGLGGHHSVALFTSSTNTKGFYLATCGRGFQGQLGDGAYTYSRLSPRSILGSSESDSLEPWISDHVDGEGQEPAEDMFARHDMQSILANAYPAVLNAGSDHTLMIARSGAVYSWGLSRNGALGLNSFSTSEASPKRLPIRERIVSISAGASHSLVLTEMGHILGCGSNLRGQIGPSVVNCCPALVQIKLGEDDVYRPVASIAAGQNHSVALTDTGQVWTWGSGSHGQLGHEIIAKSVKERPEVAWGSKQPRPLAQLDPLICPLQDRVTCISASGDQTALVTVKGRLVAFGANKFGCLGTGDTQPIMTPCEVDLSHLTEGDNTSYRVVQACCGKNHMVILLRCNGKIWVCTSGCNQFGQLGLGDLESRSQFSIVDSLTDSRIISIAAGYDHSAAIASNGEVFMWGCNDSGQLGLGTDEHVSKPTALPEVRVATPQKTLNRTIN